MKKKLLLLLSAFIAVGIIFFGFTSPTLAFDVEVPSGEVIDAPGSTGENPPGEVCPDVCLSVNAVWNGNWTNTPPSGAGPVCGCRVPNSSD